MYLEIAGGVGKEKYNILISDGTTYMGEDETIHQYFNMVRRSTGDCLEFLLACPIVQQKEILASGLGAILV